MDICDVSVMQNSQRQVVGKAWNSLGAKDNNNAQKKKQHQIACRSTVTALSYKKFHSITQKKKTTLHPQKLHWNDPAVQQTITFNLQAD